MPRGRPLLNLTDQPFGRLVAVSCAGMVNGARCWLCTCYDCGRRRRGGQAVPGPGRVIPAPAAACAGSPRDNADWGWVIGTNPKQRGCAARG